MFLQDLGGLDQASKLSEVVPRRYDGRHLSGCTVQDTLDADKLENRAADCHIYTCRAPRFAKCNQRASFRCSYKADLIGLYEHRLR
jgi:hypothetical protein